MMLEPKDCPDPSVHGNPFRYCPNCSWTEEPESDTATPDGTTRFEVVFTATGVVHENAEAQQRWAEAQANQKEIDQ